LTLLMERKRNVGGGVLASPLARADAQDADGPTFFNDSFIVPQMSSGFVRMGFAKR